MRNGRVFVRQRLTGDIFEQDGGRWPRIGGPVQALVTVGDTLYAQGVGNGPLYRYLGTGSEWIPVNSTRTGQIFRCGEGLCATDWQTGTLYEVATGNDLGVTVTDLATSAGSLFGLVSTREQILRRNDGVWLDAGNGASALASTTTDLYRVTSEGMVVEVWSSDATWSPLNHLSVRQLLGTGDELYGLLSNALGIVRWESPEWVPTGGPASRVYGSYGSLYASSPRWDEYYRYDLETNVWLYQGAP
jgi:hypothetical protein